MKAQVRCQAPEREEVKESASASASAGKAGGIWNLLLVNIQTRRLLAISWYKPGGYWWSVIGWVWKSQMVMVFSDWPAHDVQCTSNVRMTSGGWVGIYSTRNDPRKSEIRNQKIRKNWNKIQLTPPLVTYDFKDLIDSTVPKIASLLAY